MTQTTIHAVTYQAPTPVKAAHLRASNGRALCGARITNTPATASKACVVCEDLAQRTWIAR